MRRYKKGDKVIPHAKTVGSPGIVSIYYDDMATGLIDYLYVIDYDDRENREDVLILNTNPYATGGDFFSESDVNPYLDKTFNYLS